MSTKHFCDICGKEMTPDEVTLTLSETAIKSIKVERYFKQGDGKPNQKIWYDMICFDCSKPINAALRLFPYDIKSK